MPRLPNRIEHEKEKFSDQKFLVREFLLMLCVDTDRQKHTSHQNQEDSKRPFLESREFIWISVFGKPFYVDHGYFEKQISFVRSFFSGILVLFSIDGIYIRIFRQIRNIASVFERNVLSVFVFANVPSASALCFGKQPSMAIIRFHKPIRMAIDAATIKRM